MSTTTPEQWQQDFIDGLVVSLDMSGVAGQEHWSLLRQKWLAKGAPRITLVRLDLTGKDVRDYDFSRIWFGEVKFVRANLSGANFSQSIFRDCDFLGANLRSTNFDAADLKHARNRVTQTRFDPSTNMELARGKLAPEMDAALVDMAETAWRRAEWRAQRSHSITYKVLAWITDYGFSLTRLMFLTALVVLLFAASFDSISTSTDADAAIFISLRYFLALGDPFENSNSLLSALGIVEAGIGLMFLALVVAIFTKKFTDL